MALKGLKQNSECLFPNEKLQEKAFTRYPLGRGADAGPGKSLTELGTGLPEELFPLP